MKGAREGLKKEHSIPNPTSPTPPEKTLRVKKGTQALFLGCCGSVGSSSPRTPGPSSATSPKRETRRVCHV